MDRILGFDGATSFLELGCHAAPNLRLLADARPLARLTGIEINPEVARQARELLAHHGSQTTEIRSGSFREVLPTLPDSSYDVVFSCCSLAYVPPRDISVILGEALRIASRGLVILEPHAQPGHRSGLMPEMTAWRHDYATALRRIGVSDTRLLSVPRSGEPTYLDCFTVVESAPT